MGFAQIQRLYWLERGKWVGDTWPLTSLELLLFIAVVLIRVKYPCFFASVRLKHMGEG